MCVLPLLRERVTFTRVQNISEYFFVRDCVGHLVCVCVFALDGRYIKFMQRHRERNHSKQTMARKIRIVVASVRDTLVYFVSVGCQDNFRESMLIS